MALTGKVVITVKISAKDIERSMGACGLICGLCAERINGCEGCGNEGNASCGILQCCNEKDVNWCYECCEYPCGVFPPGEGKFDNIRVKAINRLAKEEGLGKLSEYLARNHDAGMIYHRTNGFCGDYDKADEEKVIDLIRQGSARKNE